MIGYSMNNYQRFSTSGIKK